MGARGCGSKVMAGETNSCYPHRGSMKMKPSSAPAPSTRRRNVMDDQEIKKQIALLLGWKPPEHPDTQRAVSACRKQQDYSDAWLKPDGNLFWPTVWEVYADDGTAIKALTTWCKAQRYSYELTFFDETHGAIIRDGSDNILSQFCGQSLARGICDAMIAAHKSMEGVK